MDDQVLNQKEGVDESLNRQQVLNILKDSSKTVRIKNNVGTHSLRKTTYNITLFFCVTLCYNYEKE